MALKNIVFHLAILCIAFQFIAASPVELEAVDTSCDVNLDACAGDSTTVWAYEPNTCFVFHNLCEIMKENCRREKAGEKALIVIEKDFCQKMCNGMCTKDYRPVCAEYKNVKRTFANACLYQGYICSTGEIYSPYTMGECGADAIPTSSSIDL